MIFHYYFLLIKKNFSFFKKNLIFIIIFLFLFFSFLNLFNYNQKNKKSENFVKKTNINNTNKEYEYKVNFNILNKQCNNCFENYINRTSNFVASIFTFPFYNPPASGIYWVYNKFENSGFLPKTYAATEGIGFSAIKPLIKIWELFRNISYMILVLVLISIGFMVMFRTKLNPQTVITVENALPKIVISLILITFSFPIAGFLIDLMYVLIMISIQVLNPGLTVALNKSSQDIFSEYISPGFWSIIPPNLFNYWNIGNDIYNIISEDIRVYLTPIIQFFAGFFLMNVFKQIGSNNEGPAKSFLAAFENIAATGKWPRLIGLVLDVLLFIFLALFGPPVLLGLLVFFTFIFIIFRIFFNLLYNYIQTILLIILSPIILLFESIPGKSTFSFWIKNIMANLLAFVLTVNFILLSSLIAYNLNNFSNNQQSPLWAPPFIYGIEPRSLASLIGLGIYFLIPDMIKMIKEFFGVKGLPFNIGIGTFFGGVGAAYGASTGFLQQFSSLASIPGISSVLGVIPGVNWLKSKVIPPTMSELQDRSTLEILKAMAITATGDQKKEIEGIIKSVSERLPKEMKK